MTATLVGEDGAAAFSSRESLGGSPSDVQSSRIPLAKQIPLKDVRPGRYVFRVEARLLGGGGSLSHAKRDDGRSVALSLVHALPQLPVDWAQLKPRRRTPVENLTSPQARTARQRDRARDTPAERFDRIARARS